MMQAFASDRQKALLGSTLDLNILDTAIVYDKTVFKANPIVFIGEAPGANEAKNGVPFCGAAGANLAKLISLAKLDRQDYYIANSFAFRPLSKTNTNRAPNAKELEFGAVWLKKEIDMLSPSAIIALGDKAYNALLKVEKLNERFKKLNRHDILVEDVIYARTFHPSPLVYNMPQKKALLEEFFIRLGQTVGTKK